jgi:hypothetical protein
MTARWIHEPAWDGKQWFLPGRADLDECAECGGLVVWESGRTLIYCETCKRAGLPLAVTEHYARQSDQRAKLAVREPADPITVAAANARLRALRDKAERWLGDWLETVADEDCYDLAHWQREASDLASLLRGWIPEIRTAASEEKLNAIKSHIVTNVLHSEAGKTLRAEYEQAQQRAARQWAAEQRAEEQERYARQLEAQREREAIQAEREAAQRAAIEDQQQRKVIQGKTVQRTIPPIPAGYPGAIFQAAKAIHDYQEQKKRKLDQYGACAYTDDHPKPAVAARRYWIMVLDWQGNDSGNEYAGAPSAVVCKKHFAAADAWIEEQAALIQRQQGARIRAVYTELQ